MKKATICAALFVTVLVVLLAGNNRAVERDVDTAPAASSAATSPTAPADGPHQGFLYGRVTTDAGGTYEGRLRFGRDEEAFWGNYFNGLKAQNPWAAQPPATQQLTQKRRAFTIFGFEIPLGARRVDLGRPFMARFGDIARIEARGRDLRVTLKSGTVFDLDWDAANDFDDGVRVWDDSAGRRGPRQLGGWNPTAIARADPHDRAAPHRPAGRRSRPAARHRAHAATATSRASSSGTGRRASGLDELAGRTAEGPLRLRFDTIRSIVRRSGDSALVTLLDGREIVLSGTREVGEGNGGIYVDDRRYGRVLVSWDAFERIDFSAAGSGPAYIDFPPGRPLTGTVTTRAGQRLTGRLVYDLDESETTETLDAPSHGVDYTIPFGLVASIVPAGRDERGARRAR